MARLAIGARTELDSTNAIDPGPSIPLATARATRSPPTNTDSKLAGPGLVGRVHHGAGGWAADGDQGSVEPAPQVGRRGDQPAGGLGVRVVADLGHRALAEVGHGGLEAVPVAPGEHYPGAFGDEQLDRGAAEPAGASRDDVDAILQSEVHAPTLGDQDTGSGWTASSTNWVR